jgi:hypothetical protein
MTAFDLPGLVAALARLRGAAGSEEIEQHLLADFLMAFEPLISRILRPTTGASAR